LSADRQALAGNPPNLADYIYVAMYYVYVLKSVKYLNRYIGSTENVVKRIEEHNRSKCRYTKGRRPWLLVYQEEFSTRAETMKREKFLKSGQGRKYLDSILK